MNFSELFCNDEEMMSGCARIIAEKLLGSDMTAKVRIRYEDLRANFNSVTYDEWTPDGEHPLWKFSSGLTPYMDYDDTSVVPIPISKDLFKMEDAVVSFDFPVWFNMAAEGSRRIMFVTQDPVSRDVKWYRDCRDALCTTVFGFHNPLWRNKGNGGKRMWLLAGKFVENGYGVYFTDGNKFAIQTTEGDMIKPTEAQTAAYREMLKAEIGMVNPALIVAFGKTAEEVLKSLIPDEVPVISLPHFSGQAQGKIKEFFNWTEDKPFTIEEQATRYFETIISAL